MKRVVEYYCKYCRDITKMKVVSKVEHLDVYWLRCTRCSNNWRVQIEELENLVQ